MPLPYLKLLHKSPSFIEQVLGLIIGIKILRSTSATHHPIFPEQFADTAFAHCPGLTLIHIKIVIFPRQRPSPTGPGLAEITVSITGQVA